MKIGTRGHYSVIAMIELGRQTYLGKPVSLSRIAEKQLIPLNYLEQLFAELKKAKLVKGVRGAFGGYLLAKAASQITVWDILKGSGESTRLNQCSGDSAKLFCMGRTTHCDVHGLWTNLVQKVQNHLETIKLVDLMQGKGQATEETLNFYIKHTTSSDNQSVTMNKKYEGVVDRNDSANKKGLRISRP